MTCKTATETEARDKHWLGDHHAASRCAASVLGLTTIARLRQTPQTKTFWVMLMPYAATTRFPLPVSKDLPDFTIMLPLCPQMTEAERDQAKAALQEAVGR